MQINETKSMIEQQIEKQIEVQHAWLKLAKVLDDNTPLQRLKQRTKVAQLIETQGIITPSVIKKSPKIETKLTGPITGTRRKNVGTIEHRGGSGNYTFRISNFLFNDLEKTWIVMNRILGNLKGEWGEVETIIQEKIGEQLNTIDYNLQMEIPFGYAGAFYTVYAVDFTDPNIEYVSDYHDIILLKGEEPPTQPPGEPEPREPPPLPPEQPPTQPPGEPEPREPPPPPPPEQPPKEDRSPITIATQLSGPNLISTQQKSEKMIEHRGKPGKYTFSGRGAFFVDNTKHMRLWVFRSKGSLGGVWGEPEKIKDIPLQCTKTSLSRPFLCLRRNVFKTFAVDLDLNIPWTSGGALFGLVAVDLSAKTRSMTHHLFQIKG